MRQQNDTKADIKNIKDYLTLPLHIQIQENPDDEAKFFALAWKKARTDKQKEFVILGLLKNGGSWDVITRSVYYYPSFEQHTGQKFPGLWR